jgi:hypothetical protein
MGGYDNVVFGELLYKDIDDNEYLNELYENILYNYSLKLFKINRESRELDISAALRFADILSKSVHKEKSDKHKEIVPTAVEIEVAVPSPDMA